MIEQPINRPTSRLIELMIIWLIGDDWAAE